MTIVERPDLSQRKGLSKSALTDWEICAHRAWFSLHHPMPWIPNPDASFGRCIDRGVEVLIVSARAGIPVDLDLAIKAALEQEPDEVEVEEEEVKVAVRRFESDVLPAFDWTFCRTQPHIRVPLFTWGDADGHPDIVLSSHAVWDVKASKKPRQTAKTLELGFYTLQVEVETGETVPEIGYLNFVRAKEPYWQGFGPDALSERELKSGPRKGEMTQTGHNIPSFYPDDDFRTWAREYVGSYVRSVKADAVLNPEGTEPVNYTFTGGPKNGGFCRGCRFHPAFGGPCRIAITEESDDE